jgi:hypothetical protein
MTPSIATKFQYINSLLFSFFTRYMFRLMYWNFVAIDGVINNQLDKYATGSNTQR